jgi:glutamate-1-semialdehyde aminotransferase
MNDRPLPRIAASDHLAARAEGLIPALTQTLAKGPGQYVRGVAPKYLRRGFGSHVIDVDGNEYLDFQMAIGPLVLGYAWRSVDEAIRQQLEDGITFSLMHPLEVEVAEVIREMVPGTEMVRFSKTGADVTSAAVRIARAYTGRSRVVCCGYHGWHDWYISVTDRNRGIPEAVQDLSSTIPYNDEAAAEASIDGDTACVILEPAVFEAPKPGYLRRLRELCDQAGAVLIFDEMWTGFRFHLGGAQALFDVRADLATFSKAVANGMPLSVLTGKRELMKLCERDVFFFTTFGGEALSLAAARATLHALRTHEVPAWLARQGRKLKDGYNRLAREAGLDCTSCVGFDCRTLVTFDGKREDPLLMKSFVQQELIRRGILWGGFHNLSLSHSDEDVDRALTGYAEVLPLLAEALRAGDLRSRMHGIPVEPVFRRTSNFDLRPRRK